MKLPSVARRKPACILINLIKRPFDNILHCKNITETLVKYFSYAKIFQKVLVRVLHQSRDSSVGRASD